MNSTAAYLGFAVPLLLPLILPFVFLLLKHRTIERKVAYLFVGAFACGGVTLLSMACGSYLLFRLAARLVSWTAISPSWIRRRSGPSMRHS